VILAASFIGHPVVWSDSFVEVASVVGIFAILAAAVTGVYRQWRLHECHIQGCHRLQWKLVPGTTHVVCKHHHPHDEPTYEQMMEQHRASRAPAGA
jgi:hypothetical protein